MDVCRHERPSDSLSPPLPMCFVCVNKKRENKARDDEAQQLQARARVESRTFSTCCKGMCTSIECKVTFDPMTCGIVIELSSVEEKLANVYVATKGLLKYILMFEHPTQSILSEGRETQGCKKSSSTHMCNRFPSSTHIREPTTICMCTSTQGNITCKYLHALLQKHNQRT